MIDQFRNYDRWKLASPDDEAEERERLREKAERDMDLADEMRDRLRDEPPENPDPMNEEWGGNGGPEW